MDRATGPPAEAIAVPHQALVHNHPRTPRTTGRPPALSQAEEIRAAPAHLRRDRARAELAESFGAGSVLDLPGRPPVDDPSCRGPRRPRAGRRRPGPAPGPGRGRRSRAVPGPEARAGPALGRAPPGRASRTPAPRPEDPYGCPPRPPGSAHDARAPQRTGLLDNPPDTPPLGDEGCIGPGMTTPIRRPAGGEPVDRQKQHNKIINSSRAPIERATAQ